MWGFIIVACLCQGIYNSEEFKAAEKPVTADTVDPECLMNVSEIIHYHGYPSEEHHVETEDGYILTIYRIPHGRYYDADKAPRPSVFLQHAVIGDATHWISNLPSNSLGFILADAGFDVWLGNSRGNTWSSNHKTLRRSEKKFWEFSFHEIGYYDLPAVIYFILNKTGEKQLYYIGHSEGATSGFIAFSTWPKLAERIKVFFCLAPAISVKFSTTPAKILALIPQRIFHAIFGQKDIFQYPVHSKKLFTSVCTYQPKFCAHVISFVAGYNTPNFNLSRMDMYAAHSPAGTSVQNLFHWKQVYLRKQFVGYDHGSKEKNMEKYNQTTPPVYKIEDIQIPIAIWTGGQDLFVPPNDVDVLRPRITNLIYEKHIPEWNHLDFIWGLDATERMYMEILDIMKEYP